ncbi:2-methoxy-6-polyprenyl-1,4-benzoquinol methylase, mitochondrial [subsurface metagenome]
MSNSTELYEGLWEIITKDSVFFIGWFREAHGIAFAKEVASHNIIGKGDRLVDIACGNSAYPKALSRICGTTFIGIDLSRIALQESKRLLRFARNDKEGENLCSGLIQGEASQLPLASSTFDIILSTHTLEHLPRDKETLKEFARILKKGGYLRLEVPNSKKQMSPLFRPLERRLDKLGHLREYHPSDLITLLSQCKFHTHQIYYRDFLLSWFFFFIEEHLRPIVRLFKLDKAILKLMPKNGKFSHALACALSQLILLENKLLRKNSRGMNIYCIAQRVE